MSWFRKFVKERGLNPSEEVNSADTTVTVSSTTLTTGVLTAESHVTAVGGISNGGTIPGSIYSMGAAVGPTITYPGSIGGYGTSYINVTGGGMFTYTPPVTSTLLTLTQGGKEIVKVKPDGSVEWASGINIDEAAEAFGKSLSLGTEIAAGISKKAKMAMRDSVFEDLIGIAKEKGALTAEDLTYLLQASKIMEKLKGGKE